MKKAILWTIAFVLVLVAALVNGWFASTSYGVWAYALVALPAVMALLFWRAYLKNK